MDWLKIILTWQWFFRFFMGLIFFITLYMIGCSDTHFASIKVSCEDFFGEDEFGECSPVHLDDDGGDGLNPKGFNPDGDDPRQKTTNNKDDDNRFSDPDRSFLEFEYRVPLGEVDIIFVVDNSSSMNAEHQNLAKQFYSFLSDIRYLDYRIAVITTDISASPRNAVKGAPYQDGRFISIGSKRYLSNTQVGEFPREKDVNDFIKAIVRPETLACDQKLALTQEVDDEYYYTHGVDRQTVSHQDIPCPSHDERGIYALNMALENPSQKTFFRPGAHLMAVVISDEDERSSYSYIQDRSAEGENYEFQLRDYPESLVENVYEIFRLKKVFSFHSIIIPPGDVGCLKRQQKRSNQGPGSGSGFYGYEYERLSLAQDGALLRYGNLIEGHVISICDRDYGSQLSKVAFYAGQIRAELPCSKPEKIKAYIDGVEKRIYYDIENRSLLLKPGQVPLSSELILNVICEK